ncbi:hypothetical protein DFH28DRAFT_1093818 [Melampsora americana]|nr:hypothetical protein DFH28DRAFT_1093818 [Melampsora americana]
MRQHKTSTRPSSPPKYDEVMRSNHEQTRLLSNSTLNQTEEEEEEEEEEIRLIHFNHQTHSTSFQFFRLLGFFALLLSILFIILISLSITHQSKIFNLNSLLFSHFSSFEFPIAYSLLSFLIIHLVLVNLNHYNSFSLLLHHTIHFTQLNILIQLFTIIINDQIRTKESGLTILSAIILLGFLDLAKIINTSTHSQEEVHQLNLIRTSFNIRNSTRSYSLIRPLNSYFTRTQTDLNKTFKHFRFISYSIFITFNTLILTTNLLSKASNPNPLPSNQLHTVQIPFSKFDHHHHHGEEEELIETKLQLKCEWLNEPNPTIHSNQTKSSNSNFPLQTKTILLFSPSSYTAQESSRWISSITSFNPNDLLSGIRFCQFDRPGYDHSFNLPITKISDSVRVMDQVLLQSGEFDQLQKNWNGIGHSGFILIGHGYGALEANVFVSNHPELIKSILYLDPETKDTFFNLDQDLIDNPFRKFSTSIHNMFKILISSWKYTFTHQFSFFSIKSISPSMTRAIIQESALSTSILAYDEFVELTHSTHFPTHLNTKVLLSHQTNQKSHLHPLEICIDFMKSECQKALIDLVNH